MAKEYSLVLSDSLFKQYHAFKKGDRKGYDRKTVERLLRYPVEDILTSTAQYISAGVELSPELATTLRKSQCGDSVTLVQLAQRTLYRIILTDRDSEDIYPFYNINNPSQNINSAITAHFRRGESREKGLLHIADLCASARKKITVYDRYIGDRDDICDLLVRILPKRRLTINVDRDNVAISGRIKEKLRNYCGSWTVDELVYPCPHHDRYIVIDDRIEIQLTGGLDYLLSDLKGTSYIVRSIDGSSL